MKNTKKVASVIIIAFWASGCAVSNVSEKENPNKASAAPDSVLAVPDIPPAPNSEFLAFKSKSSLAKLAEPLGETALVRSSAVQEARAARASKEAARAARLPRVRPTGSASLTEQNAVSLGLSLEQTLWDGGRTGGRITEQELRITEATLRAWADRNDFVRDGLEAYVSLAEANTKLAHQRQLNSDLSTLSQTLERRIEGGVADRGELLKLEIARQEVERENLSVETQKRTALANLVRLLPEGYSAPAKTDSLSNLAGACHRTWPETEPPTDAIVRLGAERAKINEKLTKSRRFPRLVLAAGAALGAATTPGVGVQIDASDMIGPGAKATVEAAKAETDAALVKYNGQRIETRSELEQLESEFESLRAEERALLGLVEKNVETYALFLEQVEAGKVEIADGIGLLRETAQTRNQLATARASIVTNCIRSAAMRGYLQPIGGFNE
jgi:adhesin transport system outer membrane protein